MTKTKILNWLKINDLNYLKNEYTINPDISVDVKGNVFICKRLTNIPFKFNKIDGNFSCSNNHLTSLEYCPQKINGNFNCSFNPLKSLKGIGYVKGQLWCDDNLKNTKEYQCYLILKQLEK